MREREGEHIITYSVNTGANQNRVRYIQATVTPASQSERERGGIYNHVQC